MRLIFLLFSLIFSISSLSAQTVQFSDLSEMSVGRGAIISAFDGENIYVCNGFSTQTNWSEEVEKYNVATDSWSILTNQTIGKRFASAEVVNNKLYIFNGNDNSGFLNKEMEIIDLVTGNVDFASRNPEAAKSAGSAVWDGKIYSFGGSLSATEFSNKLTRFDPISESWINLAQMPIAAEIKGEIVNGKLYVFGGWLGSVSNEIHIYDIAENKWSSGGTMPLPISANATAVVDSKIWIVGDYDNLESLAFFDTADNSFHTVQSNMLGRRHAAAENINGNLVVIGGNTESSILSSLPSVQMADLTSSSEEIGFENSITVFPNPTTDFLNFETEFEVFKIFDLSGKLIQSGNKPSNRIDVSSLHAGQYLLTGEKKGHFFPGFICKKIEFAIFDFTFVLDSLIRRN